MNAKHAPRIFALALLVVLLSAGCFRNTQPQENGKPPRSCAFGDETFDRCKPLKPRETAAEAVNVTIYTNATVGYDDAIPLSANARVDAPAPLPCAGYNAEASYRLHELGTGNATHVRLSLTWSATSSADPGLWIAILNQTPGKGAEGWIFLAGAIGSSPRTFDSDIKTHDERSPIFILVAPRVEGTNDAYYRAGPDQPFHVEGVITKAKTREQSA